MKKMMCCVTSVAVASMAGLAAYALMNKDTKKKADELLNTMMDDAASAMKKMK